MRSYWLLSASVVLLAACSHWHKNANNIQVPANYQEALHQKVGADLIAESDAMRSPANEGWQLQTLKTQLGDFNKIKPGKFEIYVFPKMQTMTHMEIGEEGILLGKPHIAEVSVLAVTTCEAFINKAAFSKYNPASYFNAKLAENKQGKCAIVGVTSRSMRDANRSLLREGDVLAKRLYLDEQFNVYGIETDFYSKDAKQNEMNMKTTGMKLGPGMPSTSGLDFIPVDMPALGKIQKMDTVDFRTVFAATSKPTDFTFQKNGTLVDRMALRQIGRLNKNFRIPSCAMKKMSYKDHYRKQVEMYWCEGVPWPQVVNSLQFLAVTQNISVR